MNNWIWNWIKIELAEIPHIDFVNVVRLAIAAQREIMYAQKMYRARFSSDIIILVNSVLKISDGLTRAVGSI